MRIMGVAFAVIYGFMLVKFVPDMLHDPTVGRMIASIPLAIGGAIIAFGPAFVVTFPSALIVSSLWERFQADYAQLRTYNSALDTYKRDHAEWLKTQRSWWDRLHPQRFEQEVAAFFRKKGHHVTWTGRSGDGGVDIRLTTQEGAKVIVQCKAHEKPITPGAVRELYGTLMHESADEAWLMSRSGFTVGAREFASGKAIQLLSLDHILPGLGPSSQMPRRGYYFRGRGPRRQ
jgi:hypothetical protein